MIPISTYENLPRIIAGDTIEIVGTYECMSTYEEIGKKPVKIPAVLVDTMKTTKARE